MAAVICQGFLIAFEVASARYSDGLLLRAPVRLLTADMSILLCNLQTSFCSKRRCSPHYSISRRLSMNRVMVTDEMAGEVGGAGLKIPEVFCSELASWDWNS